MRAYRLPVLALSLVFLAGCPGENPPPEDAGPNDAPGADVPGLDAPMVMNDALPMDAPPQDAPMPDAPMADGGPPVMVIDCPGSTLPPLASGAVCEVMAGDDGLLITADVLLPDDRVRAGGQVL